MPQIRAQPQNAVHIALGNFFDKRNQPGLVRRGKDKGTGEKQRPLAARAPGEQAGQLSGLPAKAARERTADVLRHVGIAEERYRPMGGYSTGMKQRVKLAQALVHDPRLLLLDEPTNGLDPAGRDEMLELIRRTGTEFGIAIVMATQSRGSMLFHDWMYPSRMFFTDKLVSMGAQIVLCDPHRCIVQGPSQLYSEKMESPDIRAGMALVLAALSAQGKSTIRNITQIDRGYERVEQKLAALGAKIERAME